MAKDAPNASELQKYATILEVPYEIKDAIKPLGVEWSNKVKTWYLAKGFDVDSVREFIEYTKKEWTRQNPNVTPKDVKVSVKKIQAEERN